MENPEFRDSRFRQIHANIPPRRAAHGFFRLTTCHIPNFKGGSMSKAEGAMEPGFYSETLDPGQAERLVLRFPKGDLFVLPLKAPLSDAPEVDIPAGHIHIELEIRGPLEQLQSWKPSVRRLEGILVLADEGLDSVSVREARVRVPIGLRDIEAHSSSGNMEIRDLMAPNRAVSGSSAGFRSKYRPRAALSRWKTRPV
jgi:hypothetical protein